MRKGFYGLCLLILISGFRVPVSRDTCTFITDKGYINIKAGILEKRIVIKEDCPVSSSVYVNGKRFTDDKEDEISFVLWKSSPDTEPKGIKAAEAPGVSQTDATAHQTDALNVTGASQVSKQNVTWIDPVRLKGASFHGIFDSCHFISEDQEKEVKRLTFSCHASKDSYWQNLHLDIVYEICEGKPAIRKWMKLWNHGSHWIRISDLIIDPMNADSSFSFQNILTPLVRGIDPSVMALSNKDRTCGIIRASEIPSKPRYLDCKGNMGYNPDYFEWVLGPGESFESEPVLTFGFYGSSVRTVSSVSTPLDRCVEQEFRTYLKDHILRNFDTALIMAPLFCTWTNYSANISETNMREAADIASKMGFKCFQLDAGWSDAGPKGGWAVSSINSNPEKFPDLSGMSDYIRSKGMETGLWYSVFINEQLSGKYESSVPGLYSLPPVRRSGGLGLSFAFERSREKYIQDILQLGQIYHARYFKQDLSNICYGDIAEGHESRTLKESYLRGLRGFLSTQKKIHLSNPSLCLQMSHEIYWETPGPAADIAVLKYADFYHISPNEYWGAGYRSKRVDDTWNMSVDSLQKKLLTGCLNARNLMYAHRGLPLERLEVFGAVTTNYKGSLTVKIQDRQICSWLMGSPLSFSGDLSSLSDENIERYRFLFGMVRKLQQKYGFYSFFQYSGVPSPTDSGWHWWGKLNPGGYGAVIVLRGETGSPVQKINIPWVVAESRYHLKGLLLGTDYGSFSGKQLQQGKLKLHLDPWGQEIIEISL